MKYIAPLPVLEICYSRKRENTAIPARVEKRKRWVSAEGSSKGWGRGRARNPLMDFEYTEFEWYIRVLFDNRVKLMLALLHNTPRQLSSSVINCSPVSRLLFEHRETSVDEPPLLEGWCFSFLPIAVLLNLSLFKNNPFPFKNNNSIAFFASKCNRNL